MIWQVTQPMRMYVATIVRVARNLHLDLIIAVLLASPALLIPESLRALRKGRS